ncbi:hypothetical protein QUF88_19660 [Bacillus sp. DX1.1]|uniref:hypothetical protein n=1 Tax=unclassified Bacillus (in: firmicutes) TaxID=185979 RepID=UPI002570EA62|nr:MULTISPECIES: hypothetical protein [unclassified Bacillus (in: firmicutes)]MDM5155929.1 hypothetical protein [Bacillus sp. DX1.1]WJE80223.1 hypothetical protein QRE67_17190 [Bacillus sp. DX3.1]
MTKKYITIKILVITLIVFSPHWVKAHVKWFTTVEPEKKNLQDIINPLFMMVALLSAILLAILPFVLAKMTEWKWSQKTEARLKSYNNYSQYILKYGTAISLTLQILSGTLFAPEFPIQSEIIIWMIWGIIISLTIPHYIATKIGAFGILSLYSWLTIEKCFTCTIDYIFYVAIAIALFLSHTKKEKWGIPILYFGTGFSLCWVAIEKLVYPLMAVDVVIKHSVPTFGFTPDVFILLCAFIEIIIGYLLLIGILNRTLAVIVTIVFILTTLIFGIPEIIGHFMLHIVLIVFLIEGATDYPMPIKIHEKRIKQVFFIFINFFFMLFTMLSLYYVYMK